MEKFFKGYGRIREINLKNGFGFVVSITSASLTHAHTHTRSVCVWSERQNCHVYVCLQEFDDHRDADDAVYELNGKELCNERYAENQEVM